MPHTPIRTRESITWRIPIDLLAAIDKYRKITGHDRTAVVVEALQLWLDAVPRSVREKAR